MAVMDTSSLHGENRRESDNVYMVDKYDTCGESILRVINCIKGETWCKCSASLCLCPAANAPCPSWRGSQWCDVVAGDTDDSGQRSSLSKIIDYASWY